MPERMLPDRQACLDLLDQAGCAPPVIEHVQAVCRLSLSLAERAPGVDRSVVQAGALLHDIGRGFTHGPDHVPRGVAFLEDRAVEARVVDCVACHMGAGIPTEQAQAWGWPERRYVPEALEEQLVCHADNLTRGTEHIRLEARLEHLRRQGLEHVVPRMVEMHGALGDALGIDPDVVARDLVT